jgi:hypothetical protein
MIVPAESATVRVIRNINAIRHFPVPGTSEVGCRQRAQLVALGGDGSGEAREIGFSTFRFNLVVPRRPGHLLIVVAVSSKSRWLANPRSCRKLDVLPQTLANSDNAVTRAVLLPLRRPWPRRASPRDRVVAGLTHLASQLRSHYGACVGEA